MFEIYYEICILKTPPVWIIIEEPLRKNKNKKNNTLSKDGRDDQCVKILAVKPRVKRPFLSRSTNGWKDNIKPNDKYVD